MPTNTCQDRTLLAGLSRIRKGLQAAIEWFSGGVSTGPAGSVTKVDFSTNLTATQVGDTLTITATGGGSSPLTTKGDLYTHDATVDARLPVGTDGQVLTADSAQTLGIKWATPSGGGGGVTVDIFDTSGTWNKPAGSVSHLVMAIGGGGGGGSGSRRSGGSGGGGGGGGASFARAFFDTALVPSTVTVTVGAGGAGGTGNSTINAGTDGVSGGTSSFGTLLSAFGGGGGLRAARSGAGNTRCGGSGAGSSYSGVTGTAAVPAPGGFI